MALFSGSHASVILGMSMGVNVIYPDVANKNFPPAVLYLLHGLSDDHTMWIRRSNVERYCDGKNLCVVVPSGHSSFYTDMKYGLKYFTYLCEELPRFIENSFNISDLREKTFAAGLSMGGYGAVKMGLTYPERFSKRAAFSGCFEPDKHKDIFEFSNVYGDSVAADDDVFILLEKAAKSGAFLPKIYQLCGNSDFVLPDNIRFAESAKILGYDIVYEQSPGNHEWDFWDRSVKKALAWMLD